MTHPIFGTAGNSESFAAVSKSSLDAPKWLRDTYDLDAYEYQCGRGVNISADTARKLGENARSHNIALSVHSPYYINLSNLASMDKNIDYVLKTCAAAHNMGAFRIVVHAGAASGRNRIEALEDNAATLAEMLRAMYSSGYESITICVETMGKINQMGTFEEIIALCANDERLLPCIDFGHLYARTLGATEGYAVTAALFDYMENELGKERASRFHSHFSKIEFTQNGGEKRHVRFDNTDFGPDFRPIARLVAERGYAPTFICESDGTQAEDAAAMKAMYIEEMEKLG